MGMVSVVYLPVDYQINIAAIISFKAGFLNLSPPLSICYRVYRIISQGHFIVSTSVHLATREIS